MTTLEIMFISAIWVTGIFMIPTSAYMIVKSIDKGKALLAYFWFFLGVFCPFMTTAFAITIIFKDL